MKRKLYMSITLLVIGLMLMSGGVLAWFLDSQQVPFNRFQAATVNILQNETITLGPIEVDDWFPGETIEQEIEIVNTGSVPIYLRGQFTGWWKTLYQSWGQHHNTARVTAEYTVNGETFTVSSENSAYYHVWLEEAGPSMEKEQQSTMEFFETGNQFIETDSRQEPDSPAGEPGEAPTDETEAVSPESGELPTDETEAVSPEPETGETGTLETEGSQTQTENSGTAESGTEE